ncbi:hypothetical protein JKG47_03520 [Acidithiobacillus sp. MC6.1]|nr:hypothetical protein [Acidithiobacillus sp. MC6.1]
MMQVKNRQLVLAVSTLVLTGLGGCATQWQQAGIPRPTMEKDLGRCEAQAAQKFPVRLQTVQTGSGYWTPASSQCWRRRWGLHCQQYPAQWNPPQYGTEDINAPARQLFVRNCMQALGFHN